jgi:hypothetical protein
VTDDDLLDLRKGENRVHRRSSAMLSQGSKGDAPIPNGQSLEEILAAALARAASDKGYMALGQGGCVVIVNAGGRRSMR